MAQFYDYGPGGQDVTLGAGTFSWDGAQNLSAYGNTTGSAGGFTLTNPGGWGHGGWHVIIDKNTGNWEINWINWATNTARYPLSFNYSAGAQVVTLTNGKLGYRNLTISGNRVSPAFNGNVGGIIALLAKGTITINGGVSLSTNALGYIGGQGGTNGSDEYGLQGGSYNGTPSRATAANYGGGGGGQASPGGSKPGGGGAGHVNNGTNGSAASGKSGGTGGGTYGQANLNTIFIGSGGGQGAKYNYNGTSQYNWGGYGGGIVILIAKNIIVSGTITCNGGNGSPAGNGSGGGGGGAGGSILLICQTATLGTNLMSCAAGSGGALSGSDGAGGAGSVGRIAIRYYQSYTGSTNNPAIGSAVQDNNLRDPMIPGIIV